MLKQVTAVTAAILFAAAGAVAQTSGKQPEKKKEAPKAAAEVTLKVGDKAPTLSVEQWIKGDEVKSFESGKVYVVEFWATWCGPCRESIPHLTDVQKHFKDKGVTVLGIASSERKAGAKNDKGEPADTRLDVLKKFVTEKGDEMKYTIGYDEDRSMSKSWMQPAGQGGIPCAFVVGKDGKIAWIGHPMQGLDEAVKKAVGGAKASLDNGPAITLAGFQPEKKDAAGDDKSAGKEKVKAKAPAAEPDTTLFVGDKAPEITVSKWVKGEPVTGFEKGKVYVVEYWATWCGPCKESIPHLTELQKEHKDVKFIGVSVWESDQKAVEPFVKDMGDKMAYTVAMDDIPAADGDKPGRNASMNGKMARNWMAAAGQHGIPTAFIVNGEGKVAWIGHPMSMEEPLEKITSGKWDLGKEAEEYRRAAEVTAKLKPLQKQLQAAMQVDNWDGALAALDEIAKLDPKSESKLAADKFVILLDKKHDYDKAFAYGNVIVDGAIKDNAQALNQVAWTLVDPDNAPEKTDLKLAMKAATRAYEVSKGKDPAITDTLAKVYFDTGDMTKALEYQEKAAKMAEGTQFEDEIKGRLEQFREAAKKKGN
jgi:thiol-disulfide isomerase/thioredoxin